MKIFQLKINNETFSINPNHIIGFHINKNEKGKENSEFCKITIAFSNTGSICFFETEETYNKILASWRQCLGIKE